MFKRPVIG
ncbi:hypothetical protein D027_1278A, partial [Vibrio parahaemolyticus 861]